MKMKTLSILVLSILLYMNECLHVKAYPEPLFKGFSATPDPSVSSFQFLYSSPDGDNFSLGFLRVNQSQLALAILHNRSSEPIWVAKTTSPIKWSKHAQLFFNGSLVLTDHRQKVVWSTQTSNGDHFGVLNTSNLQVHDWNHTILWQSFDHPSDTLIENQNFTAKMSLESSNEGLYSMKLGEDYIGLYSHFEQGSSQIYWRRGAMEAKAQIVEGKGPIYAQISSNGYLGMYQTEVAPVDVLPFDSFQSPISGIHRLKLESDGNLKAYYWNGSSWITDYTAVSDECELPNSCGFYGLCQPGKGCECLDNETEYRAGQCFSQQLGDVCSKKEETKDGYWVLRRNGVELPNKELMEFKKMASLEECEGSCEKNCSCWGALFNNASGYCYQIDNPITSLVRVGDEKKLGYFKVRRVKKRRHVGYIIGISLVGGALVALAAVATFGAYRVCRTKRRVNRLMEDGTMSPGPYKDLHSTSFGSVELLKGHSSQK